MAMSITGLPLPLTAQFDFLAWRTVPVDLAITDETNIATRNKWNRDAEIHNAASIVVTKTYERAVQPGAPPNATANIDVGRRLLPYYPYTEMDKELMIESELFCNSVGPLPVFMLTHVVSERLKKAKAAKILKDKKDKELEEKEKAKVTPLLGSVVTKAPRFLTSSSRGTPTTPNSFLQSMKHKQRIPLHWFSDAKLRHASTQPHDIPLEKITPEASPDASSNPEKVHVVSVAKLIKTWGGDEDTTHLTPHSYQQCTNNELAAWQELCGPEVANIPSIASNYKKHRDFFLGIEDFEQDFSIWYPEERFLRHAIYDDIQFAEDQWSSRVGIIVKTYHAAAKFHGKRSADGDLRQGPQKIAKKDDSFRTESFRTKEPPTGPRNSHNDGGPACLICAGGHRYGAHPPGETKFSDGKLYYVEKKNGDLFTRAGVQVELCALWNLNLPRAKCDGCARKHACSFCGKDHPALSRSADCARVVDGKYRP
ncbi:hypothetical protein B0H11DRAFT_2364085 [Mycena galericulata]|nr:hypothetical protein B0H11DRAFT_2364085 [Mycena galericulata]